MSALTTQPVVNEDFLKDLAGLARRLVDQFGVTPASADGLLALRGVLEAQEILETDEERAATDAAILSALDAALAGLEEARRSEGSALGAILAGHLDRIAALTAQAEADPSREPAVIRERIADQVRLLLDAAAGLDETRLTQGSGAACHQGRTSARSSTGSKRMSLPRATVRGGGAAAASSISCPGI